MINSSITRKIAELTKVSSSSSVEFHQFLGQIQNMLGTDDGGFAAIHFGDRLNSWSEMSRSQRRDLIVDYVWAEIRWLIQDLEAE